MNCLKLNFRIFAPIIYNFKKLIGLRFFEEAVASINFTYCFIMKQQDPVGGIRYSCKRVENSEAPLSGGFRWAHTNGIIATPTHVPPLNSITTLQTD